MLNVKDIKYKCEMFALPVGLGRTRRGRYAIWNLDQEKAYPCKISLKVPKGAAFKKELGIIASWAENIECFAASCDARLDRSNRGVGIGNSTIDVPTSIEFPTEVQLAKAAGKDAVAAIALRDRRVEKLMQDNFAEEFIPGFIWQTQNHSDDDFGLLVTAAAWIRDNDVSQMTPRELPIPDMQGKLLNRGGDRAAVATLLGLEDLPLCDRPRKVELKYHDSSSTTGFGLCVLGTPNQKDLAQPGYPVDYAVIVENKDTFDSFPCESLFSTNTVILYGCGNAGSTLIPQIPWLHSVPKIYYWGDMDTDGLEIMARYRRNGLSIESILMDRQSFMVYKSLGTRNDKKNNPIPAHEVNLDLSGYMTPSEQDLYESLCHDTLGKLRVEQEKIPYKDMFSYIKEHKMF